jgi:hypothetical protein
VFAAANSITALAFGAVWIFVPNGYTVPAGAGSYPVLTAIGVVAGATPARCEEATLCALNNTFEVGQRLGQRDHVRGIGYESVLQIVRPRFHFSHIFPFDILAWVILVLSPFFPFNIQHSTFPTSDL